MRRPIVSPLVLLLVVAACSSSPERRPLPPLDVADAAAAPSAPELSDLTGRLVVLDGTGNLTVMRPDGTERVILAKSDAERRMLSHPTWSPDGRQVAWTELGLDDRASLVVAPSDGSEASRTEVPFPSVYMAWDPRSEQIAFVGRDVEDGSLGMVTVAPSAGVINHIDSGAPFYLDWAPTGEGLAIHVANRLAVVLPDGGDRVNIPSSGSFRVPTFVGDTLIHAIDTESGPILVTSTGDAEPVEIARFGGTLAYTVHPDGERVAALATGPPGFDGDRHERAGTEAPDLSPNELTLIDLSTGSQSIVDDRRAVVWHWSPNGDRLLFGTFEQQRSHLTEYPIRWHMWDGTSTTDLGIFVPSALLASQYLPFFDQFERSMSVWSPDGSAFVYAGRGEDREAAVWVQRTDVEAGPSRQGPGVFAAWAPSPEG